MNDAPVYTIECRTAAGDPVTLHYSPYEGDLSDAVGRPLLSDVDSWDFAEAVAISPSQPGRKSGRVSTLKIQLGMACNYNCSYCSQASFADDAPATRTADVERFLSTLPTWLEGAPTRIEFWGGEPLLYMAKLRVLVPALRDRFPAATFSMVTNGTLMDEGILDFIEHWDILVGVSHDGPGQHRRGSDPFADPGKAHWLRELWRRRGGARRRVTFIAVFTAGNADIRATRAWLAEAIGDPEVALETEGVVAVYDDHTLDGSGRWTSDDYAVLSDSIVAGIVSGEAFQFRSIHEKARDFLLSLQHRRPARALGQKCGMDAPDQLAVDLHGNVMTCQNTGAQGQHRLGNVDDLKKVALDTATHWMHRECCTHCPVIQLCRGSCMFLDGDHFAQSCENEYAYNTAILAGVIARVTGLRVEGISGDIRRPALRRTISIRAAE